MKNIRKYIIILLSICRNFFFRGKVIYLSDSSNWIIRIIGLNLKANLAKTKGIDFKLSLHPFGLRNNIIHLGSVSVPIETTGFKVIHSSNKIIMTWFHILENDSRIKYIPELNTKIDYVHTAAENTKKKLIAFGLNEAKIKVIPLGIDPDFFYPYSLKRRQELREKLGISSHKIVIGSFQKDGIGWGDGHEPKLEKGPDVFCDAVIEIDKKHDNIVVLLSGPARGYVKKRLKDAGIEYIHHYFDEYNKVADFYNVIDLYIVASREEGLPMAVLESMACGVPLISTRVGLAPEMIIHGENGFLCEVENHQEIADKANELLSNNPLREKCVKNGIELMKNYTWKKTAENYLVNLYSPLNR